MQEENKEIEFRLAKEKIKKEAIRIIKKDGKTYLYPKKQKERKQNERRTN